jgi:hypothetical protein
MGFSGHMLVGYMRVSTEGDRQVLDLQRDALLSAGVDERHLFEDRASGSRGDRAGLAKALAFAPATVWLSGSWTDLADRCPTSSPR